MGGGFSRVHNNTSAIDFPLIRLGGCSGGLVWMPALDGHQKICTRWRKVNEMTWQEGKGHGELCCQGGRPPRAGSVWQSRLIHKAERCGLHARHGGTGAADGHQIWQGDGAVPPTVIRAQRAIGQIMQGSLHVKDRKHMGQGPLPKRVGRAGAHGLGWVLSLCYKMCEMARQPLKLCGGRGHRSRRRGGRGDSGSLCLSLTGYRPMTWLFSATLPFQGRLQITMPI